VSVRDLQRANSRRWPTRESAQEELEALANLGFGRWVDLPTSPSGGHPQRQFRLHAPTHDTTDTRSPDETESSDARADTCRAGTDDDFGENAGSVLRLTAYGSCASEDEGRVSVVSGADAEDGGEEGGRAYDGKLVPPQPVLTARLEETVRRELREDLTLQVLKDADIDGRVTAKIEGLRPVIEGRAEGLEEVIAEALDEVQDQPWTEPIDRIAEAIIGDE
jgi:hypothetical protein